MQLMQHQLLFSYNILLWDNQLNRHESLWVLNDQSTFSIHGDISYLQLYKDKYIHILNYDGWVSLESEINSFLLSLKCQLHWYWLELEINSFLLSLMSVTLILVRFAEPYLEYIFISCQLHIWSGWCELLQIMLFIQSSSQSTLVSRAFLVLATNFVIHNF